MAKYLPQLVTKLKEDPNPYSPSMRLINTCVTASVLLSPQQPPYSHHSSPRPYFIRYIQTDDARGLAALQTKRTADRVVEINAAGERQIAELNQFPSTLLALQGTDDVDDADKNTLVPYLKRWIRQYDGLLGSQTSERVWAILTNDRYVI